MKKIAVLKSEFIMNIPWLAPEICTKAKDYTIEYVDCDSGLEPNALIGYSALINPLGKYYEEQSAEAISNYYCQGGIIFNLGPNAFTTPYIVENGNFISLSEHVDLIRSIGRIDLYVPLTMPDSKLYAHACLENYKPIANCIQACDDINNLITANYNFGRFINDNLTAEEPNLHINGKLEPIVELLDKSGKRIAVPIVKTSCIGEGTMYYFNFNSNKFWQGTNVPNWFSEFLSVECDNNYSIFAEFSYARYKTNETPILYVKVYNNTKQIQHESINTIIKICSNNSTSYDGYENWPVISTIENIVPVGKETQINLPCLNEAAYTVTIIINGKNKVETGFYVLSEDTIAKKYESYPRMIIDKKTSTEFHTQNGEICPIHGTTYFVTDNYRNCYLHMNPVICNNDMIQIKKDGFNLVRTGIWSHNVAFYGLEGSINERGIRALQAFFYTAMEHNLTVQYVMGNMEINDWDRKESVIHNNILKEKVYNMLGRFFQEFCNYTNVQLDIVNEPSYSIRGAWKNARPTNDSNEIINWREWLKKRYNNNITSLRIAWGMQSARVKNFDTIELPSDECFTRQYNRTECYEFHSPTADFFDFARDSFINWCKGIKRLGQKYAPNMIILMGRDESIRIPCEQDEFLAGNIDTINWHQWQQNGIIFTEYILNKMPESICCGQELGVYQMENHRGFKRLNEDELAGVLERKLLYSLGNWVQWQWMHDPYMDYICENTLGIYHSDRTEMPGIEITRHLGDIEQRMAPKMAGNEISDKKIFVLHPTSAHFSCDQPLAVESIRSSILTLSMHLKEQFYVALEHTLPYYEKYMKNGGCLIIIPSAQIMKQGTWEHLLKLVEEGNNILINGSIEKNEYYFDVDRMKLFDNKLKVKPLASVEKLDLGGEIIPVNFLHAVEYCNSMHALDKCEIQGALAAKVQKYKYGKGSIYHCSIPIELCSSYYAIDAVYEKIIAETRVKNSIFEVENRKEKDNFFVYTQCFMECIVYTIINEGTTDSICIQDKKSGKKLNLTLEGGRGTKIWLSPNGKILGKYELQKH